MSKIVFTTNKYIVKTFSMENFDDFLKINMDPVVSRYVNHNPNEAPKTYMECLETFKNILDMQEELGYAYWAIYAKNNEFIGQCGLSRNYDRTLNFCYALNKKFWGRGIGTEIAGAIIDFLFKNFNDIKEIKALSFKNNGASVKILTKIGFANVGEIEEFNKILYFFKLTREMYEQKGKNI
jgi:RimJ/RimL family protein N-acetyltransferase